MSDNGGPRSYEATIVEEHETIDEKEYEAAASKSMDEAARKVELDTSRKLVVAIIGNVGSGKSALTNAMFGEDVASVHPIAGWSKEVKLLPLPRCKQVVIADTPGLQDVSEVISETAVEFQEKCDIFIYALNAAVGATHSDERAYAGLVATGHPVACVLNKADIVNATPEQRRIFVETTRKQVGASQKPFFACSADPHPAIAPSPIGVDAIVDWLLIVAKEQGKDLILARALKDKRRSGELITYAATAAAGAAGMLPIPGSDYVLLTGIQAGMLIKLSYIYGKEVDKATAVGFITQIMTSGAGRQLYRLAIQGLKAAGWLGGPFGTAAVAAVAGSLAASITYGIGKAWVYYLESDFEGTLEEILPVFEQAYRMQRTSGSNETVVKTK